MALSVKIARKPKKPRVTREINMGSEPRFDPDKIADPHAPLLVRAPVNSFEF